MVPPISASTAATGSSSASTEQQQHQNSCVFDMENKVDANVTVNNKMMDATLLRNALRLVHCIQKERGASCAYFASHDATASAVTASATTEEGKGDRKKTAAHSNKKMNSKKRNRFETQLQQARMGSNVALQLLTDHIITVEQRKRHLQQQQKKKNGATNDDAHAAAATTTTTGSTNKSRSKLSSRSPTLPLLNNLMKIRNLLDMNTTSSTTGNSTTSSSAQGIEEKTSRTTQPQDHHDHNHHHHPKDELVFHRILVCFNTLINFIAQEYIHKHTKILSTSSSSPSLHAMGRSSSRHRKLNTLGAALASSSNLSAVEAAAHAAAAGGGGGGLGGRQASSTDVQDSDDDEDEANIHKNCHRRTLSIDINDKLSSAWKISPVPQEFSDGGGRGGVSGYRSGSERRKIMNRIDSVGYDDDDDDDDGGGGGGENDTTLKTKSRNKSSSDGDHDLIPPPPPPLLPPRVFQQLQHPPLQPQYSRRQQNEESIFSSMRSEGSNNSSTDNIGLMIGTPSRHSERNYGERGGGGGGGAGWGSSASSWLAKIKPPSSSNLEDVARSYDSIANEAATLIRKMSFAEIAQYQNSDNNYQSYAPQQVQQQPQSPSKDDQRGVVVVNEEHQSTPRQRSKPVLAHSSSDPPPKSPTTSETTSGSGLLNHQLQQHSNQQQKDLLDLLNCFVQLKESTGVERAILSGMLAFEDATNVATRASAGEQLLKDLSFGTGIGGALAASDPENGKAATSSRAPPSAGGHVLSPQSRQRLFSDLIVEVENQRRLIAMLREFPIGNSSSRNFGDGVETMGLSNLVLELTELSPSLLELQTKILNNPGGFLKQAEQSSSFESDEEHKDSDDDDGYDEALDMLRDSFVASSIRSSTSTSSASTNMYDPETIFKVITIYMDKLHSLELLIVEELEACCQPLPGTAPSAAVKSISDSPSAPTAEEQQQNSIEESQSQETSLLNARPSLLETTASLPSLSNALRKHVLVGINGIHGTLQDGVDVANVEYVVRQVEAMSPQQIKTLLLDALQLEANNAQRAAPPALPSGDEVKSRPAPSLQHQYSSWAADEIDELNDKINSALASSSSQHSESGPSDDANRIQRRQSKILNRASSKEWEIGIYEIKFQRRIGQGASGTTYRGTWSGQSVAVKVASITEFGLDGWRTEVSALQRLHHPNVIRLLGSVYHENPLTFCLVLEYCNAGGKLCRMLQNFFAFQQAFILQLLLPFIMFQHRYRQIWQWH